MAWSVVFTPNTERDRVGSITATWEEPTGEKFEFIEDQINTNNATQKNNFVARAKSRQSAWKTKLDKDKSDLNTIKTELETLLNS